MNVNVEKFWQKVEKGPGCWEWRGCRGGAGYGRFGVGLRVDGDRKTENAHRASFFIEHGYWPEVCCHHCDNPGCVRPDHLYDGTFATNSRDMVARGRHNRQSAEGRAKIMGRANPNARLTDEQIQEIREIYSRARTCADGRLRLPDGLSAAGLGRRFGVCDETIAAHGRAEHNEDCRPARLRARRAEATD